MNDSTDTKQNTWHEKISVSIANFSLLWQQGPVEGQFEWHRETDFDTRIWDIMDISPIQELVISNFVFKHPNLC